MKALNEKVKEYINLISENVPEEMMEEFGVGPAGKHNEFGTHYGFWNDRLESYTCIGSGYNIANDFNAVVHGSSDEDVIFFLKEMDELFNHGINELKKTNQDIDDIMKKLSLSVTGDSKA